MFHYTILQWFFFFFLYCFLGWCFESTYVSIKDRRLTNRGFMRGPLLPIYGSGATMMLVVSAPFKDNIVLTYLAGCVGATALEYVTGVTMEALFHVRYWDYSEKKFNFQGHICLSSTLAWGFFTILMTGVIHRPIEEVVLSLPIRVINIITITTLAIACADFALSLKAAIDLRIVLEKMSQAKQEMSRLHKRLDVLIAVAGEEVGLRKDGLVENIAGIKDGITDNLSDLIGGVERRLSVVKKAISEKPGEYWEKSKEELFEIRGKYSALRERINIVSSMKDFFQRDMIRSNPSMTSFEHKAELEELKKKVFENDEE